MPPQKRNRDVEAHPATGITIPGVIKTLAERFSDGKHIDKALHAAEAEKKAKGRNKGLDFNTHLEDGSTLIHLATRAVRFDSKFADKLLKLGASINCVHRDSKETPLDAAILQGDAASEVVSWLKSRGAKTHAELKAPYAYAAAAAAPCGTPTNSDVPTAPSQGRPVTHPATPTRTAQQLTTPVTQFRANVAAATAAFETAKREELAAQTKAHELQHQVVKQEQAVAELALEYQTEVDKIQSELRTLANLKSKSDTAADNGKKKVAKLEKELTAAKKTLEAKDQENQKRFDEYKLKLDLANEERCELQSQLESRDQTLKDTTSTQEHTVQQLSAMTDRSDAAQRSCEELLKEKHQLEDKLGEAEKRQAEITSQYDATKQKSEENRLLIENLQAQLEKHAGTALENQELGLQLDAENRRLVAENTSLRHQVTEAQEELHHGANLVASLKQEQGVEVSKLQAAATATALQQLHDLESEARGTLEDVLQTALADAGEKLKSVLMDYNQHSSTLKQQHKAELKVQVDQLHDLKAQLRSANADLEHQRQLMEMAPATMTSLTDQVKCANDAADQLRADLKATSEANTKLRAELSAAQNEVTVLARVKAQLERTAQRHNELRSQVPVPDAPRPPPCSPVQSMWPVPQPDYLLNPPPSRTLQHPSLSQQHITYSQPTALGGYSLPLSNHGATNQSLVVDRHCPSQQVSLQSVNMPSYLHHDRDCGELDDRGAPSALLQPRSGSNGTVEVTVLMRRSPDSSYVARCSALEVFTSPQRIFYSITFTGVHQGCPLPMLLNQFATLNLDLPEEELPIATCHESQRNHIHVVFAKECQANLFRLAFHEKYASVQLASNKVVLQPLRGLTKLPPGHSLIQVFDSAMTITDPIRNELVHSIKRRVAERAGERASMPPGFR